MNNVSKELCTQISKEIDEAVGEILARHGLEATQRKSQYGDWYKFTVQASPMVIGDSGVNEATPEASAYLRSGKYYGLNEGLLGKEFTNKGETFKFCGIATSRRKFPIKAMRVSDGQTVFFTEDIARLLNA
jgi:hypothetical protein